ncbi:MAG: type II secretion system F family protein [Hyphomonas sp.]|uniref:type II secretion system F family protein n=1 Tax=Hyphomonas sp. TaxID=87 RepID=UPI0032987EEA
MQMLSDLFPLLMTALITLAAWILFHACRAALFSMLSNPDLAAGTRILFLTRSLLGDGYATPGYLANATAVLLGLGAAFGYATGAWQVVFMAVLAVMVAFLSAGVAGNRRWSRELEKTLPSALQQIANEMATTGSLEHALEAVIETAPSPARNELVVLRSRISSLGIDAALERTTEQLNSPSFSLMSSVIRVGTQRGGNLPQALKDLGTTLIEMERMRRKIRTAAQSSKTAVWIMAIAIPVLTIVTMVFMPGGDAALSDPRGITALVSGAMLYVLGIILLFYFQKIKI